MKARLIGTIALAVGLSLAVAGCAVITSQATQQSYAPSDGVSGKVGGLEIRNALIVTTNGSVGNLVLSATNTTNQPIAIDIAYGIDGTGTATLGTVAAGATVAFGTLTATSSNQVRLNTLNTQPGALVPVIFRFAGTSPGRLSVPVLDGRLVEYSTLTPTLTATPTPTATILPATLSPSPKAS